MNVKPFSFSQDEVLDILDEGLVIVELAGPDEDGCIPEVGEWYWVQEKWAVYKLKGWDGRDEFPNVLYYADQSTRLVLSREIWEYVDDQHEVQWREPAKMPDWASRMKVVVTRVNPQAGEDGVDIHVTFQRIREG